MQSKVIFCPKCQAVNAPGVSACRNCGIRLCLKCNSAMPLLLGVCPQCGWWDPDWKSPERLTTDGTSDLKFSSMVTKKLEFKCPRCGANVDHEATACLACGHIGHMQLREAQN